MIQKSPVAPIAIFAYRRPDNLQRCLNSLLKNPECANSDLYIFIDGPKSAAELMEVQSTIEVAEHVVGFKSISVVKRDRNLGLANSIRTGIDRIFLNHDKVIVLEDDLVTSSSFLGYMNQSLATFENTSQVISVQGSNYFANALLSQPFFLTGADCWGWGTWRGKWKKIEWDPARSLNALQADCAAMEYFDLFGSYPHSNILKDVASGRVDSWAILFHANASVLGLLSLYPHMSQVSNDGNGLGATHMTVSDDFSSELFSNRDWNFSIAVQENETARKFQISYFQERKAKTPKLSRLKYALKRMLLDIGF